MFRWTRVSRRRRVATARGIQALESRALLAATAGFATAGFATAGFATAGFATAGFDGQTLSIRGTDAPERVSLRPGVTPSVTEVVSEGQVILRVGTSRIQHIQVLLRGGNDTLAVDLGGRTITSFQIQMGSGVSENLQLRNGRVGTLTVSSQTGSRHLIDLEQWHVTGEASLSFSGLTSRESIAWRGGSVGRLSARLGGGDDRLELRDVRIQTAQIDLGEGDDSLFLNRCVVSGGFFQAGGGKDLMINHRGTVGASLSGFEQLA